MTLSEAQLNRLSILRGRRSNRTDKYQRILSEDIIEQVLRQLDSNGFTNVTTTIKMRNGLGTAHCIEFTLHDARMPVDGGILPKIIVFNSYNGECKCTVGVGIFRFVCSNGLMLGDNYFSVTIRHLVGDTLRRKLNSIEPGVAAALAEINTGLLSKVEQLRNERLTMEEAEDTVEQLGLSTRMYEDVVHYLRRTWSGVSGRPEDADHNMWTLFNIVNEVQRKRSRSEFARAQFNRELLTKLTDCLTTVRSAA